MHKRILAIATLLCAVPLIASAWTLNTWVRSQGGNIQVGNYAKSTVLTGSTFKSYTSTNGYNAVVTADANYFINNLIIDGVPTTPTTSTSATVAVPSGASSIWVDFLRNQLTFNVVAGTNGIVTPSGAQPNVYAGVTYRVFSFIPAKGQSVTAVTADVPANIIFSTTALNQVNKKVIVTVSKVTGNVTLTGSFSGNVAVGFGSFSGAQTGTAYKAGAACDACHIAQGVDSGRAILTNWSTSGHRAQGVVCAACHQGASTGAHPGTLQCSSCHNGVATTTYKNWSSQTAISFQNFDSFTACSKCHNGGAFNAAATAGYDHKTLRTGTDDCTQCHQIAIKHAGSLVNDNNGVRAIVPEFSKRSHHITGAAPRAAQCIVCHLEGQVVSGQVVLNTNVHMKNGAVHLRNADTNAEFTWSGTEHANMDNFCFSCHDSNGATGITAAGIDTVITVANGFAAQATALNPFGDTLTNGYDQVARANVVDVKTAFTATNASHHAVSGQRYTYRFSTRANADAWSIANGGNAGDVPDAQIAQGHTSAVTTNGSTPALSPFGTGLTFDAAGPEEGGEATLYEAGKFVSTYIPLGASQNVADNSTLHCGDCHTVGQWKVGTSTNADGSTTSVAIGAHGSANEYLLRNSLGTDALHNNLTYVCFNCHKASQEASSLALWNELVADGKIMPSTASGVTSKLNCADFEGYTDATKTACVSGAGVVVPTNIPATLVPSWKAGWGSLHPTVLMGQFNGYYVAHAVSAMHGQCQADSADNTGAANRTAQSWEPDKVKAYDYLPASGATATAPATGSNNGSGNITGIACINCHNSGLRSGFGGIHGGNNVYTDGLGRTQMTYRFMPGMGNYRYAPPGGWDGKDTSDATLLTANNPLQNNGPANGSGSLGFPGASGKPIGGCYTNGAADLNTGYSSCSHHGTSTASSGVTADGGATINGVTTHFRTTYGGGTSNSPTTYEPTVREATAGGALVTRPLSY